MSKSHCSILASPIKYAGFVPSHKTLLETLKPGETVDFRETKLGKAGSGVVYGDRSSYFDSPWEATSSKEQRQVSPSDYHPPSKLGIMKDRPSAVLPEKTFIGRSAYASTYRNFQSDAQLAQSTSTEVYKMAFDSLASVQRTEIHPTISIKQIRSMLLNSYGVAPPNHQVQSISKVIEDQGKTRATFEEIMTAINEIADLMSKNCNTRAKKHFCPAWMRNDADGPNVIARESIASTHQTDMGRYGENPRERSILSTSGGGRIQVGTTHDMCHGTNKSSNHIPGYGGFIPTANANPIAVSHGLAEEKRDALGTLRMTYTASVPGYTGHLPQEGSSMSRSPPKASKLTTTGASQLSVTKAWNRRLAGLETSMNITHK